MQGQKHGAVPQHRLAAGNGRAQPALFAHLDRRALVGLDGRGDAKVSRSGVDRIAADAIATDRGGAERGEDCCDRGAHGVTINTPTAAVFSALLTLSHAYV